MTRKATDKTYLESLCMALVQRESGADVKKILKANGLWDDDANWIPVGAKIGEDYRNNNASIIQGQQADSVGSLVDNLCNCSDSALMLKCVLHGVDPKGDSAPGSVTEAKEMFLGAKNGKWIDSDPIEMGKLGEEFSMLIATGEKPRGNGATKNVRAANPTYTIVDQAEGQHPEDFPTTFLGLTLKNKTEINFVQGKFAMGGLGVANHVTEDVHLILSKRNPALVEDPKKRNAWGWTIVRKNEPTANSRLPEWVYLVIDDKIPSFEKESLPILPGKYPNPYGKAFKYGTFKKLYNYDIGSGYRSNITLDLWKRLNRSLINPVVPVKLFERRPGFTGKTKEITVLGLENRLHNNRNQVVETGFPHHWSFSVDKQKFEGTIYVFKQYPNDDKRQKPIKKDDYANGVLFSFNGQTHHTLESTFFHTVGLKFESIKNNILVILDCSALENKYISELFQPNRETLFDKEFARKIKDAIRDEMKDHQGLRDVQHNWHMKVAGSPDDNEDSEEKIKGIIKEHNLYDLFNPGTDFLNIVSPDPKPVEEYNGSYFPTKFKLRNPHPQTNPRSLEEGRTARIWLSTDAPNDYLVRAKDPGHYKIFYAGEEITNEDRVILSGSNGKWRIQLPERKEPLQHYTLHINDLSRFEPFKIDFWLKLTSRQNHPPGDPTQKELMLDLPKVLEIYDDQYHEFDADHEDFYMVHEDVDSLTYFVMMDNKHLQKSLKGLDVKSMKRAKELWKNGGFFLALSAAKQYHTDKITDVGLNDYVRDHTRPLGQAILPITSLD